MKKIAFKKTKPGKNLSFRSRYLWLDVRKERDKCWLVYYNGNLILRSFCSRWLAARWLIKYALEKNE